MYVCVSVLLENLSVKMHIVLFDIKLKYKQN